MKVIVFDLDDTLYDEMTYVYSGFRAVARYLHERYEVDENEAYDKMCNFLSINGRGSVFDDILKYFNVYNQSSVKQCISVYRGHSPKLALFPDAEIILSEYASYPLYIVTDGNKLVQHRKLEALQLYSRVKKCFVTHRYGRHHAKPSPYCFLKIAKQEKVEPKDIIYVGDNVSKDFVGIKPLGFNTAQVMRGSYVNIQRPKEFQADWNIHNLLELRSIL